jgi:hypothetical protein
MQGVRTMLTSIQGVYRDGKIELTEKPANMQDETPVIVTFLSDVSTVNLQKYGITPVQAGILREQLEPFAEEWDSPEMNIYDK